MVVFDASFSYRTNYGKLFTLGLLETAWLIELNKPSRNKGFDDFVQFYERMNS